MVGSLSITKRLAQMSLLALGIALAGASVMAGGGYLATVGPSPIRFAPIVPRYDPEKVLPPLDMGDAPATDATDTVTTEKTRDAAATTEPSAGEVSDDTAVRHETAQPPRPESIVVTPQAQPQFPEVRPGQYEITPQMLLRYFTNDGTNSLGKEVLVPLQVEFTPPAPASSGNKSSATYLSPPAK